MATTKIPTRTELETATLAARRLIEFREMMQRFEFQPRVGRIDAAVPATTLRNLDHAFGLVPLPKKREPKRQPPAISADVYAAMLRWA